MIRSGSRRNASALTASTLTTALTAALASTLSLATVLAASALTATLAIAALSAAAPTSAALFSPFHNISLLFKCAPSSQPAASATSRHHKKTVRDASANPGINDLTKIAGHKRNHLNPGGRNQIRHGPGNRPADQSIHTQSGKFSCFSRSGIFFQNHFVLADNPPALGFHDPYLPGHIKDRCNSIVPHCKRRFHQLNSRITIDSLIIEQTPCHYAKNIAFIDKLLFCLV